MRFDTKEELIRQEKALKDAKAAHEAAMKNLEADRERLKTYYDTGDFDGWMKAIEHHNQLSQMASARWKEAYDAYFQFMDKNHWFSVEGVSIRFISKEEDALCHEILGAIVEDHDQNDLIELDESEWQRYANALESRARCRKNPFATGRVVIEWTVVDGKYHCSAACVYPWTKSPINIDKPMPSDPTAFNAGALYD